MLNDDDHDTQMEASKREHNNEEASEWEQNNEDAHSVSVSALDQNNENVCDGSQAQDQNNKNILGAKPHYGGETGKQITYREALIGLDNSEPSSDF